MGWAHLNGHLPEAGTRVVVANRNEDSHTGGFLVNPRHISARKPVGTNGVYKSWVPGAGGDLWWIEHEDGSVGAYAYTELEPAK